MNPGPPQQLTRSMMTMALFILFVVNDIDPMARALLVNVEQPLGPKNKVGLGLPQAATLLRPADSTNVVDCKQAVDAHPKPTLRLKCPQA